MTSVLIQENFVLAGVTSWQIGGPAQFFSQPETLDQLRELLLWAKHYHYPLTLLGGGSNVLIADEGVRGLVVCFKKLNSYKAEIISGRLILNCEAGVKKSELLKIFMKYQLSPALFLAGIPGEVGGGVVMNAGVSEPLKPREFGELVDWIEVLRFSDRSDQIFKESLNKDFNLGANLNESRWNEGELELIRLGKEEIQWSYRKSRGWQPGVIYRVGISWPNEPDCSVVAQVRELNQIRLQKQPLDLPSCGSVFKNPPGQKAAHLIDQAGLKGIQIGGAQVSPKHANFIVNLGQASAQDTWKLVRFVQEKVFEKFAIQLETEVVRLGEWKDLQ